MGPTIETTSYKNAHDLIFGYKKNNRYAIPPLPRTHVGAEYCTNVHISAPDTITLILLLSKLRGTGSS
jgi:hypothetical protein